MHSVINPLSHTTQGNSAKPPVRLFTGMLFITRNVFMKIQIMFEGPKASGVVIKHEGQEKVVKTTGEIILAAGTVGTTKLLLLSGVGPKAHLQELKV